VAQYDSNERMRDARARYFEANGFGDGGYDDRFVVLRAAGVPVVIFPNTKQRVRSVRLHDLHHVLTGYDTTWRGEGEIAAWELVSGCRDHWAAWVLNFWAAVVGLFVAPLALWRAAQRGRAGRNLYARPWEDALLERTVGELRHELGLEEEKR
jgi:ubiquinone biosynthesis protein Coq4